MYNVKNCENQIQFNVSLIHYFTYPFSDFLSICSTMCSSPAQVNAQTLEELILFYFILFYFILFYFIIWLLLFTESDPPWGIGLKMPLFLKDPVVVPRTYFLLRQLQFFQSYRCEKNIRKIWMKIFISSIISNLQYIKILDILTLARYISEYLLVCCSVNKH